MVRGPHNMNALLSSSGRTTGIHVLTWSVGEDSHRVETYEYYTYPRKIEMSHPEPLLFSLWELLQSKMQVIMEYQPDDDMVKASARERAKNEARGIAEALAILMKPFIDNADDVARHAARYYKDNTYDVPGLGTHLWDPMMNPDGTPRTQVSEPKAAPARRMLGKKLTEAEAVAVKQALTSGMFTVAQLAEVYKVSAVEIEAQK